MPQPLVLNKKEERRQAPTLARSERRLYPAAEFAARLATEIAFARSERLPLSVVVLQVSCRGEQPQQRREVEIALRLAVRAGDLHARLAEGVLAIAVLKPTASAGHIATRLTRLLAQITTAPVTSGVASYPEDATQPLPLLRLAAWRSLSGAPRDERAAQIQRLLGLPPAS